MTTITKKKYHHGNLREALLLETERMISDRQLNKVTLLSISKQLGVVRSAAYRHFANKNDLLCAVASRAFLRFKQGLQTIHLKKNMATLEQFRKIWLFYFHFALENPDYYKLMFREALIGENQSEELKEARESCFFEIISILQKCQQEGIIGNDSLDTQAMYIWANQHGLCSLLIDQHLSLTDEELDKTLNDYFNKTLQALA